MGLKKCPRCELNYIKDDEKLCNVCRRSARKEPDESDEQESLCIECGEHPAMKGRDVCALCYKEMMRQEQLQNQRKTPISGLDLDDVELKEVDVPITDDIPAEEIADIDDDLNDEFDDDDDEADEEQEKPVDDGEIDFNEDDISVEALEEDDDDDDADDEIDEGVMPARRTHR